jgi:uncharacterized protein (TIGR00297 family)
MVAFALFIGRLPPWMIVICALGAFLFNWFLLPGLTQHRLEKPTERQRGRALGLLLYPSVLTGLALLFYSQQVFVAIGWGAMAFGDAAAAAFGPHGRRVIPWQPAKHWLGSLAFVLVATPLTWGLLWLLPATTRLDLDGGTWLALIAGAMVAAALVETIPGLIDDNLSVPLVASVTAGIGYQWLTAGVVFFPMNLGWGLVGIAVFAVLGAWSGKIDAIGATAGGVIAVGLFLGGNVPGLVLLFLLFVLGTLVSSVGKSRKQALGLAQAQGGQRSLRHALANGGVAGFCGLMAWGFPQEAPSWLAAMAGALASALGDTFSSELGNLYGRRYLDLIGLGPGQRGDDGVISLEGTLLGAGASLLMAFTADWGLDGVSWWPVLIGGLLGNLADSWFGATLQRQGYMTNDTVNVANTMVGALVAGGLAAMG